MNNWDGFGGDEAREFTDEEGFSVPNDDQEEYDTERGRSLERGFHTTKDGDLVRLVSMGDRHLKNTIAFGKRSINERGPAARFWQNALRFYQQEETRRSKPKRINNDKG